MPSYLQTHGTRETPQSERIPGSNQVQNEAGGYAYSISDMERARRFLVLGSEGGTYYASERKLTTQNAQTIIHMAQEDGLKLVQEICAISHEGRAAKNDPAIFALAIAASLGDEHTRKEALLRMPDVCRTGTHLFMFVTFARQFRGWGRGMRNAVARWYLSQDLGKLAYQLVKYRQRDGWSHRDLLRLAHPITARAADTMADYDTLFKWVLSGEYKDVVGFELTSNAFRPVRAYERAQRATKGMDIVHLIEEFGGALPREAIPTDFASTPEVWRALLNAGMPQTALIRNLANLTRAGVLQPMYEMTQMVCKQITDQERLTKARVHPVSILGAMATYGRGRGVRGSNTWEPLTEVLNALDTAFYRSFGNVQSTGKRFLIGLDVSGSMGSGEIAGMPGLTPRVGAAAMSLVTAATEPHHHFVAFTDRLVTLNISPRQRLDDVLRATDRLPFGRTDCAQPMLYALERKLLVDAFIIYTDNETWVGHIHPVQALRKYREWAGERSKAKLIVVGMTSSGFSIADPSDAGMLDVVGFDTATPNLISDFVSN